MTTTTPRVTSGVEEAFAALSLRQQAKVEAVVTARAVEDEKVRAVMNRSREAVRKALDAGVPARVLADRLGVSPARVYQMRDLAAEYATQRKRERDAEKAAAR